MKYQCILLAGLIMISPAMADINDKIEANKVKIDQKKSQEKKLAHQLDQIAKDIAKQKSAVRVIIKKIDKCKGNIQQLQKKSQIKSSELQKIEKIYKALAKKEKHVSQKVVSILSKELSIEMITKGGVIDTKRDEKAAFETNLDDIMMNDVLHTYTKLLREKFHKTKSKYIKLNKSMDIVKQELKKLSNKVDALKKQKATLNTLKKSQKKSVLSLYSKKKRYLEKLNRIKNEQNSLLETLNQLHITKEKQDKTIIKESSSGNVNVRQIGSSYQHGKLIKYRGPKTIAPLHSYTVTQNFGNYTDPIYKIKIFNESVILRASKPNAKVRNVLDGTVIYAENTAMLDDVVIIKHKNNLHTIYAHLSQIAPNIRVGKRLKKGYILGRVKRELTFEVTQDTKHINPMRLIK